MANFIISYDLNGNMPTHAQVDAHLKKVCGNYGRVLETVWFATYGGTTENLYNYINTIMSANDRLLVVRAVDAVFRNLIVNHQSLIQVWNQEQ